MLLPFCPILAGWIRKLVPGRQFARASPFSFRNNTIIYCCSYAVDGLVFLLSECLHHYWCEYCQPLVQRRDPRWVHDPRRSWGIDKMLPTVPSTTDNVKSFCEVQTIFVSCLGVSYDLEMTRFVISQNMAKQTQSCSLRATNVTFSKFNKPRSARFFQTRGFRFINSN